jgi:lipoprotein-releasing system permease protein
MPFELYVALRYLLARRKQAFLSLISAISTLGVAVGVAALIIAIALMTGLQGELRDRMLGAMPHIYVSKLTPEGIQDIHAEVEKLRTTPHVVGAAPTVVGKALIRTARSDAFITIEGIDPALESQVNDVARSMQSGKFEALTAPSSPDAPDGILIGQDLAKSLGTFVGDSVTVLSPEGTVSPFGVMPRTRRLKIVGIYALGLFEFDSSYGYVTLDVAKRLTGQDAPQYIKLRVDNIYEAPRIAADINRRFGKLYLAQDCSTLNASLFSALWLEKVAMSITIGLIMIVAALNIVASLVLLVMEKSRDIAILKTMGASARSIMIIFMLQGVLIGIAGLTAGAVLGRGVAYVLDHYKLIHIPIDVYQITYVPFRIETSDFLLVLAAAFAICFIATIYPSRQASRLDPAEALRYA